jgi:hypothetical protein
LGANALPSTKGRTLVTVHTDYHDDERRMSAGFRLPKPLPPDEDVVLGEVVDDAVKVVSFWPYTSG